MREFPSTPLREPPPAGVTRLFLMRHGATEFNERRPFVLQGAEIDPPLTELGREQARSAARALQHFAIGAVYSSTMHRAIETAEIVAQPHGREVVPLAELRECGVGTWAGKSWDQIRAESPAEYESVMADPVQVPHPGGESYSEVLARIEPTLLQIFERHRGMNVVIVGHNMVNRIYLAGYAGLDLKHARRLRQTNCCINLLHHFEGTTELVTLNSVLHLDLLS